MKKISRVAALFILLTSFSIPLLASAACPSPYMDGGNGQCYSVDANNVWTLVPNVYATGKVDGSTCFASVNCNSGYCDGATETCQPKSGTGGTPLGGGYTNNGNTGVQTSSGGGINLGVITPYSEGIKNLINSVLVPVLMAIALITFFWGVYKYFILGADSETERATGRQFVLWGIIGFVVIVSLWGLVAIVGGVFGLQPGGSAPSVPKL
jgi:hypothetical protein